VTNVRFCANNLAAASTTSFIATPPAVSGFPASNATVSARHRKWVPSGRFVIASTNCKIYINDGSDKTVTLTTGVYNTGALLAIHVQTQLNASSSNWTASYSTTTGKFTIGRSSGTSTFRFATTTDAAWSTLGYTQGADASMSTGTASTLRVNHTSEVWAVDLGSAQEVTAFHVISTAGEVFPISSSATVTLKAKNASSDFTTGADLTVTLTRTDDGIFEYLDDEASSTYRYWQFEFADPQNTVGPEGFPIAYIYLGQYTEPTNCNIVNGFSAKLVDPSVKAESDAGVAYWRLRTKYWRFENVGFDYLSGDDRTEILALFKDLGQSSTFFVSLDPTSAISSAGEFTKYVTFDEAPSLDHFRYNLYAYKFSLVEVV
jgi:hypothetical protein